MEREKYKKNEHYSQKTINRIFDVYLIAKAGGNMELAKVQLTMIYDFIRKYVYSFLWESYPALMGNKQHREDLIQEIWVKIFSEIDNYDYNKGALTTFVKPWIKHVVAEYCSRNFKKTSVYYSAAMNKVVAATNYCKHQGVIPNFEVIVKITGLPEATVTEAIDLLNKKDYASYENLAENGFETSAYEKSPEEQAIENAEARDFNEFLTNKLSVEELEVVRLLMNPDDPKKAKASYREIATFLKTNIPHVKTTLSRITAKLKYDPYLRKNHPELLAMYDDSMADDIIPVLDDEDFIEEQMRDLKDFVD